MIHNEELFSKCLDYTIAKLERIINISTENGFDCETEKEIKKVLETHDKEKILELINKEIELFYHFAMSRWIFYEQVYQEQIYQHMTNKEYERLGLLLMYVPLSEVLKIDSFKKWFESLSETDYDDFIYSQIRCLDDDEYSIELLKRLSDKNRVFSKLYYDIVKKYIYTDDNLINNLINNYLKEIEEEDYIYLWENYKDKLLVTSLENKILIMKRINDKQIQQEMFNYFKIINHLNNIEGNFGFLISFIDDEELLINILIDKFLEHSFSFVYDIDISKLSEKIQKAVFTDERLNGHRQFKNIEFIKKIHPNVLSVIIIENEAFDVDVLYNLYKINQTKEILNLLINKIDALDNVEASFKWLYTDLYKSFSDDLVNKILNLIDFPSNKVQLENFFYKTIKLDNPFCKKIKDNAVKFISTQEQLEIVIPDTDIMAILNEQEFEMLFNKMPKANQLRNITINESFLIYAFEILQNDKDYFKDVIPYNAIFAIEFEYDVKKNIHKLEYIFGCLNLDEQKELFFDYKCFDNSTILKNYYKNYVFANCDKLTSVRSEYFSTEQLLLIAQRCNFELLSSLSHCLEGKYDVNLRIDDLIDYINKNNYISINLLKLFTLENIKRALLTANIDNVFNIVLDSKEYYPILFDRLKKETLDLNRYNSLETCRKFFVKLADVDMENLLNIISSENLISLNNLLNESKFENEIVNRIKNNKLILGTYDTTRILFNKLSKDNYDYIKNSIEFEFNNINQFLEFKDRLKDKDLKEKMVFNYIVKEGYLNSNTYEILINMYNKDPFLFYSFEVRLLRDDIFMLGEHFVSKTSRYPNVAKKVVDIFDSNSELGKLLVEISKNLTNCEKSNDIYDKKMEMIINYLFAHRNNFENFNVLDNKLLNNIEDYILQYYIIENSDNDLILDKEFECDIANFNDNRRTYLDNRARNSKDIEELRNVLYNRYFWLDSNRIKQFIRCYVTNYSDVIDYAVSDLPIDYLKLIMKIESITDFSILLEFYNTMECEFTISDYMTITGIMSNAYNKANSDILKQGLNSTRIEKEINIDGTNNKYQMNEMFDSFGIFVHSTCAYGEMPLINDDYFESWNYNPNTENHGICSCYITNSAYGIPPVEGNGVLFGFTDINEHSVATMAPYDLVTINNGYTISSIKPPLYMRLDKVSSFTRHTHNEFDLERRNTTIENRFPCIQPNCVVIFEEMDDRIKTNSIKAVEDFKKHGVYLDIIYIDRKKIIQNEASKLDNCINIYEQTYNLDLLSEIIDRYESNRCSCKHINEININDVFQGSRIYNLLNNTIDYLSNILDNSYKRSQISKFINILDSEQAKFDIIIDLNKERANKFNLYDDELKERVRMLKEVLYQEYNDTQVLV